MTVCALTVTSSPLLWQRPSQVTIINKYVLIVYHLDQDAAKLNRPGASARTLVLTSFISSSGNPTQRLVSRTQTVPTLYPNPTSLYSWIYPPLNSVRVPHLLVHTTASVRFHPDTRHRPQGNLIRYISPYYI